MRKVALYINFLCVLMIIIGLLAPFRIFALSPSSISMDISPQNPAPGESVTVTLSSYATNLDSILISWYVNGKKTSSGIGIKSFTVNTQSNTDTSVRAVVAIPDGEIEKKVTIRPSVMTLLWEATDSYVPPFYKGKAMPIVESQIKVIAMPETKGGLVNQNNMLYSWNLNYANDASASGYGKSSFTFVNDYLESSDTVSVEASSIDGAFSSQATINIVPFQPTMSFYKNDNLLGVIWEQALKNNHKIQGDEVLVAAPYFISPKQILSPNLNWKWFINDNLTNNTFVNTPNWLPIKVEGGVSGIANIRLEVENNDQLLGNMRRDINVEF